MTGAPGLALPRHPPQWRPIALRDRQVLVVGLGSFGGGIGAARFLLRGGARVTVTDLRSEEELGEAIAELRDLEPRLVLGEHRLEDLEGCEWVVASPAVPMQAPILRAAASRGIPVESEITLLCRLLPCPWLGITGTNGKSTTALLARQCIAANGRRVHLGGNLGGSLLDSIAEIEPDDVAVLELSSFQLEHLAAAGLGPPVALITNVTPDHLDRHGSFAEYVRAKAAILGEARVALLNRGDPVCRELGGEFPGEILWFGRHDAFPGDLGGFVLDEGGAAEWRREGRPRVRVSLERMRMCGEHNRLNLTAAAAAATCFGAGFEESLVAAIDTDPIFGRLVEVGSLEGVRFVDDCVSTSPPAVIAALSAFSARTHLLMGGYDKGIEVRELLEELLHRGTNVYLFGAVAPELARRLDALRTGWEPQARQDGTGAARWETFPNLESAFLSARSRAVAGDVVLLSPGFASYDQFRNFAERGELFRSLVKRAAVP
jgi:UDP-N-acetylmuramoylalanine--D-glutamate ligase